MWRANQCGVSCGWKQDSEELVELEGAVAIEVHGAEDEGDTPR